MSVPADSLYLAGLVPGLLLVVLAAVYGIYVGGWRQGRPAAVPLEGSSGRKLGSQVGTAATVLHHWSV